MIGKADAELMLDFQEGDTLAFEKLVLRHQVPLYNFLARLGNDRELAEDLTQEVFLKIYTHADRYVPSAKFTTYLYRIARNAWIDRMRREGRRGNTYSIDREDASGSAWVDRMATETPPPDHRLEAAETRRIVEEETARLPQEQRLIFVLAEVRGLKYAEIAEILEIPVGTVKSRMHFAVRKLRENLEKRGVVA